MNKADKMHAEYFSDDYKRGYKEGKEHRDPSEKTLEKFDNMSEEITNIKVEIGEQGVTIKGMNKTLEEMKTNDKEMREKMDAFITQANNCYATKSNLGKLEKKFWISLTSLLGVSGAIIYFLIDFIMKKLID